MYTLPLKKTRPMMVTVSLDGREIEMEVDTGASLSVISETTYRNFKTKSSTVW